VTVLRDLVCLVPLFTATAVEYLAGDAEVVEHGLHLVDVTEVLGDEHEVEPRDVEPVLPGVRDVLAETLVLTDRGDDHTDVPAGGVWTAFFHTAKFLG